MRNIPYGIVDYKNLVEKNCVYVDKTMYLDKLENMSDTLFYLRPGRFGKSLFTSMMFYYYDVNSIDLFDKLFKDTYVYNNPTKDKNNYYVLKFDFSGIETAYKNDEELALAFKNKVISGLENFNNYYKTDIKINIENDTVRLLDSFINEFDSLELGKKLYVIIDEYDNFTNAILEGDAERFTKVVGNEGVIKAFYAIIKERTGKSIGKFFATGICPVTLDSMTTGFNIATDISTDLEFNEMIGLTHDEVKKLLEEFVDLKDRDNIYNIMIKNYDGYLFNKDAKERVFNATLVMYLLNYYERFKEIPDEIMDRNIISNYGKIGNIIKLKGNEYYEDILDQLLKTSEISSNLRINFNLEERLNKDDIISLLYYFGYLTIKEYDVVDDSIIFKVPNKVMKDAYNNYFLEILESINVYCDDDKIKNVRREIFENGKIDGISYYISEILKETDNRIFMNFDEKYIALLYYTFLRHRALNVYLEYPCSGGYIDVMVFGNNDLLKKNIMIELKYIKKKDYNNELLREKVDEGREQLLRYGCDKRLSDSLKYLVVFVGNELKTLEEVK